MSFVTESLGLGRNALAQKGYYGWARVRVGLECWRGVALKDSYCEAVKVTQPCMCSNSTIDANLGVDCMSPGDSHHFYLDLKHH